jgi:hypothetical protein
LSETNVLCSFLFGILSSCSICCISVYYMVGFFTYLDGAVV